MVDKTSELARCIRALVQLVNEATLVSSGDVNLRQVLDAAQILAGLKPKSSIPISTDEHASQSMFTQFDDEFWSNPANIRALAEVEQAILERPNLMDGPSFSLGISQDLGENVEAGVSNIARDFNEGHTAHGCGDVGSERVSYFYFYYL